MHQVEALKCLNDLHTALQTYSPTADVEEDPKVNDSWFDSWFGAKPKKFKSPNVNQSGSRPKSFYFWGGTGSGKVGFIFRSYVLKLIL
jgi:predicted ATPase